MIRKAKVTDIPRIAEIIVFGKRVAYREIFHNDMESFNHLQVVDLANEYYRNNKLLDNMLVYDDGIIKGAINRQYRKDTVEICDFYVEPFFKNVGIGTQLLSRLIQEARQEKRRLIYLWVIAENINARKFYEQKGFSATGETKIIEGTDKLDVYYELLIASGIGSK